MFNLTFKLCIYTYMWVCVWDAHLNVCIQRSEEDTGSSGTKLKSSERVVCILKHWAISPLPSWFLNSFYRKTILHTDFQTGCISLQSQQQWTSVLLSPHWCQHLWSYVFPVYLFFFIIFWDHCFVWRPLSTNIAST